jgi:hypothetical protein
MVAAENKRRKTHLTTSTARTHDFDSNILESYEIIHVIRS